MTDQSSDFPLAARLDLHHARQRAAGIVVFLTIFLSCVGYEPLRLPGFPRMDGGDSLRQASYLLIFFGMAWAQDLAGHPSRLGRVPREFIMLFAWSLLSLSWSVVPATGLQRLGLTIITVVLVYLTVDIAGVRRTQKTLMITLGVILFFNFVSVLLFPASSIHGAEVSDPKLIGNWNGMSIQKNLAGAICACTLLVWLLTPLPVHRMLRIVVILAAAFFLYMTKSKTSMGVLAIAAVCGLGYRCLPPRYRTLAFPLLLIGGFAGFVVGQAFFAQDISDYFTAPDALTGRAQIWPLLIEYSQSRPWTGAGFGSFWTYNAASPIHQLADDWVEGVPNGHNGYLDVLVDIGIPGVVIAAICVFLVPLVLLLVQKKIRPEDGALPLALLIFAMLHNVTESTLLNRDTEVWVFALFGGALARKLWRETRVKGLEPAVEP